MVSNACTGFDATNNTDPDLNTDYYTYIHYGGIAPTEMGGHHHLGRYTTVNSASEWSETLIANAQEFQIEIIQYLDRGES